MLWEGLVLLDNNFLVSQFDFEISISNFLKHFILPDFLECVVLTSENVDVIDSIMWLTWNTCLDRIHMERACISYSQCTFPNEEHIQSGFKIAFWLSQQVMWYPTSALGSKRILKPRFRNKIRRKSKLIKTSHLVRLFKRQKCTSPYSLTAHAWARKFFKQPSILCW